MTTNPHLNNSVPNRAQVDLDESIVIEAIQFHGSDVLYVPRKWVSVDDLTGDIIASKFDRAYQIEMIVEGVENLINAVVEMQKVGFGGIGSFSASGIVSKRRFDEEIPADALETPGRPCEGDLVFLQTGSVLLEIKSVEHDPPQRTGGRLHVYRLGLDLFRYSGDSMNQDPSIGLGSVDGVPELLMADDFKVIDEAPVRAVEYGNVETKDAIDNSSDIFVNGGRT